MNAEHYSGDANHFRSARNVISIAKSHEQQASKAKNIERITSYGYRHSTRDDLLVSAVASGLAIKFENYSVAQSSGISIGDSLYFVQIPDELEPAQDKACKLGPFCTFSVGIEWDTTRPIVGSTVTCYLFGIPSSMDLVDEDLFLVGSWACNCE